MIKKEIRVRVANFRSMTDDKGKKKLCGMPIVYGKDSDDLGWFTERIATGAAANALLRSDPRCLFGHNSDTLLPLGRMSAGTMRAVETGEGVEIEVDPPDTQFARDLMVSIERGDIRDMSFGFSVHSDVWATKDGKEHRTITEIGELFDFSFVTFPAYPDTTAATRSLEQHKRSAGDDAVDPDVENEDLDLDLLNLSIGE